jgi:Arc/MetJ family transcription regulator
MYMRKRTNIELDEELIESVQRRYRLRTKTEAVDLALRRLAGEPMTREEALAMEGARAILEIPPDQPPRGRR